MRARLWERVVARYRQMNGHKALYFVVYPTLVLTLVVLAIQVALLLNRFTAPSTLEFIDTYVLPDQTQVCPGDNLEVSYTVQFRPVRDVFYVVESVFDVDSQRTVIFDKDPEWFVQGTESGAVHRHQDFRVPGNLEPGNYLYRRAIAGPHSPTTVMSVPFVVPPYCRS